MEEGRGTLVARAWWCTVYIVCSVAPLKSLKLPAISPGSRHFTMGGVEEKGEEDHFKSALPEVGREERTRVCWDPDPGEGCALLGLCSFPAGSIRVPRGDQPWLGDPGQALNGETSWPIWEAERKQFLTL